VGKEERADVYLEVRERRGHIFLIFLFSTATFKYTYRPPSDELDKNKQRTWLGENFSH
jgi:hypothetical protein